MSIHRSNDDLIVFGFLGLLSLNIVTHILTFLSFIDHHLGNNKKSHLGGRLRGEWVNDFLTTVLRP